MSFKAGCMRIKLKPGSLPEVKKWAATLRKRKEEVQTTMIEEGIFIESAFLDKVGKDHYLIYYIKTFSQEKSGKSTADSKHSIDAYHNAFKKKCWAEKTKLSKLIDFDLI